MTLRDEIKRNLKIQTSVPDKGISATLIFPSDFTGFKGHFPGQPVVPGLCMVQAVLAAYEMVQNAPIILQEIISAKFYKVIHPDTPITLSTVAETSPNGRARIKAVLTDPAQAVMARMTLRLNKEAS